MADKNKIYFLSILILCSHLRIDFYPRKFVEGSEFWYWETGFILCLIFFSCEYHKFLRRDIYIVFHLTCFVLSDVLGPHSRDQMTIGRNGSSSLFRNFKVVCTCKHLCPWAIPTKLYVSCTKTQFPEFTFTLTVECNNYISQGFAVSLKASDNNVTIRQREISP